MLRGPEWDDPDFVQFDAVHPRPDVAATYEASACPLAVLLVRLNPWNPGFHATGHAQRPQLPHSWRGSFGRLLSWCTAVRLQMLLRMLYWPACGDRQLQHPVPALVSQLMTGVRLQYNDVPGSDEEMELGLGSDASLASSCGERSCTLGIQRYLLTCRLGAAEAGSSRLVSHGDRGPQRAGAWGPWQKLIHRKACDRRVCAGGSEVSDAMSEGERPDEASSLHPESEDPGMLAHMTDLHPSSPLQAGPFGSPFLLGLHTGRLRVRSGM